MEKKDQKKTQTKANQSYLGLFMVLTLILTIPVTVLFLQQRQDIRERAAEPTQPLLAPETKTTTSRTFSGYVYYDDNQDGTRQPGERPYPNVSVQLIEKRDSTDMNETNNQAIQTDANGYFTFQVPNQLPELTYAVLVVLPDGYKTINTNPTIFSQSNGEAREVAEFGLFPLTIPR